MDPTISTLGIPTGVAGWQLLQGKTAANFPALTSDPVVKREIAYFEANAPKATTAAALLANPRLQDFVLTAYGLTSESGMTALMTKVLNSNPANSSRSPPSCRIVHLRRSPPPSTTAARRPRPNRRLHPRPRSM